LISQNTYISTKSKGKRGSEREKTRKKEQKNNRGVQVQNPAASLPFRRRKPKGLS